MFVIKIKKQLTSKESIKLVFANRNGHMYMQISGAGVYSLGQTPIGGSAGDIDGTTGISQTPSEIHMNMYEIRSPCISQVIFQLF